MIELDEPMLIGKGRDRQCYLHPENLSLCIKVSKSGDKQSLREKRYFAYLQRQGANFEHLSPYRGSVFTSIGKGFLFDLAKDFDGSNSQNLDFLMKKHDVSLAHIGDALNDLQLYLAQQKICVRDLSPRNIGYQRTSERAFKLVIIDGVSNSNWNPLTIRLDFLLKRAQVKAWKSLERKLQRIDQSLNQESV